MEHNSLLFSRKLKTAIAETAKKSEPSCTTSWNAAATGTTTRSGGVRGTTKTSASVGGMFEDATSSSTSLKDQVRAMNSRLENEKREQWSVSQNVPIRMSDTTEGEGLSGNIGIAAERQAIGRLLQSMKEKPLGERQRLFRQQLRKYHPDKGVGTEEDAKRINEAAFHFLMEQQGWFLL
eukprot:g17053.t1